MRSACRSLIFVVLLTACAATTSRTSDDLTTTTAVKIALLTDAEVGGLRLEVSTAQGVVTLAGTVASQAQADRAVAVAKKTRGVRGVRTEMKIAGLGSQRASAVQ
jgi:hyperosmotically inducible periplasmic protein